MTDTGITARAARPEEAEAVLEILGLAFGLDIGAARPIFYSDPFYDLSHKRVLPLPGAGIVSCLTVVPTQLRIGGVPVPAGGVAGVATRPAFQRRGHAAALLAATVPALWSELGYPLSLLHPVSAPFYRRFGWEEASRQVRWLSAPASLPVSAEADHVRPVAADDWPVLARLHERLSCAETGTFQRDTRRWQLIAMPLPNRETFVYEQRGQITGYLVCERHDILHLLEMLGATADARRGLLGFLARRTDALIEWATSPALLHEFGLPEIGLTREPGVMLRIVDLEAALTALHAAHFAPVLAEHGQAVTVHATDPLCPQNARPLRLTAAGVQPDLSADGPWLRADIRVLARLYLGDLLPSEAAAVNLLTTDSPHTSALADRLFPRRRPYVAPLDQF